MTPADFRELAGLIPKYDLFAVVGIADPRTIRRLKAGAATLSEDQQRRLIAAAAKVLADRLLRTLTIATSGRPGVVEIRLTDRVLKIEGRHLSEATGAAVRQAVQEQCRAGGLLLSEG